MFELHYSSAENLDSTSISGHSREKLISLRTASHENMKTVTIIKNSLGE